MIKKQRTVKISDKDKELIIRAFGSMQRFFDAALKNIRVIKELEHDKELQRWEQI